MPKKTKSLVQTRLFNDVYTMDFPAVIANLGPPRSGKTNFNQYFAQQMGHNFHWSLVICGSDSIVNDYYFINPEDKYPEYKREYIANLIKHQSSKKAKENNEHACLYLDDVMGVMNMTDPPVKALFSKYRHYRITIVLNMQYIRQNIPGIIKEATSYASIFRLSTKESKEAAYDAYGGRMDKDIFMDLIRDLPQYAFLFYDNYYGLNRIAGPKNTGGDTIDIDDNGNLISFKQEEPKNIAATDDDDNTMIDDNEDDPNPKKRKRYDSESLMMDPALRRKYKKEMQGSGYKNLQKGILPKEYRLVYIPGDEYIDFELKPNK